MFCDLYKQTLYESLTFIETEPSSPSFDYEILLQPPFSPLMMFQVSIIVVVPKTFAWRLSG